MRSSFLLTPTRARKVKEITQMATESRQRFTFYEDLYLKNKTTIQSTSKFHYNSSTPEKAQIREKRKDSESIKRSSSQSPVNNPLLDSPPASRPLTIATNTATTVDNHDLGDTNNNNCQRVNADYRNGLYANTTTINVRVHDSNQSSNSNYVCLQSVQMRRGKSLPADDQHVYEVIPAQKKQTSPRQCNQRQYKVDENNYVITKPSQHTTESARLRWNGCRTDSSSKSTSNLRAMRRIGRSVDSIRGIHGNKLRSQSTILAPQLWMKSESKAHLPNAASCGNLVDTDLEFSRLTHGLTSLDKENLSPDLLRGGQEDLRKTELDSRLSINNTQQRHQRSEDNVSQKSSNSSIHSASSRTSHSNYRRHYHRHSSSYSGSTSTYENMDQLHKTMNQGCSNYVNIQEFQPQEKELNYADLDFTPLLKNDNDKNKNTNARLCRSVTPTKSLSKAASADNDDSVEYTIINIQATQAARLACAEHQRYRQRRVHSTTST